MLYSFLIFLFVVTCILLVVVILMQASKGGGLASSFGGMGSAGGILGARGASSFLQKTTIALATFFGLLCLIISVISTSSGVAPDSKTQERIRTEQQTTAPLTPPPGVDGSATKGTANPSQPAPGSGADNSQNNENPGK